MGVPADAATTGAITAIQQLAVRYALAVDSRDLAAVASLYVDDVDRGPDGRGRDVLVASLGRQLRSTRVSIHVVTNHVVHVVDADNATGTVYHRGERQAWDGTWSTRVGAYDDRYVRRDGEWLFLSRTLRYWYWDEPVPAPGTTRRTVVAIAGPVGSDESLPDAWPTWRAFVAEG
jgi:hypothetical protein